MDDYIYRIVKILPKERDIMDDCIYREVKRYGTWCWYLGSYIRSNECEFCDEYERDKDDEEELD